MENYNGKNIWIIGASSGIGEALARELHARGASLALSARSEDKLKKINRTMNQEHLVIPCDVADVSSVQTAIKATLDDMGQIDHVVFLAALYTPGNLVDAHLEDIRKALNVNIGGAMNVVHEVVPVLRQGSTITLCGSVAGYRGLPKGQPYSATKAAVINLAESLKLDLAPRGIDVKVINPGFVRTPLTDKNNFKMPMMIEPEEAAKAIAKGLQSKVFEIHFPKKFTFIMKLLQLLPHRLYFWLSKRMI